jgi:hypothetical protein
MVHSLYLTSQGESAPSANLRFQFNREHQVAAAVLVALDKQRRLYGGDRPLHTARDAASRSCGPPWTRWRSTTATTVLMRLVLGS